MRPARIALALLASAAASPAVADEYTYKIDPLTQLPAGKSAQMRLSEQGQYDSNALRSPTRKTEIYGSTTSPELLLGYQSPMTTVASDSRVDANLFDKSEFNSVDFHEALLLGRHNQTWAASLRGTFDYDTTRESEVTNYALNLARVHSTRYGAMPSVSYRASEYDTLSVTGYFSKVHYDNNAFVDYTIYQAAPRIEHKFDPANSGNLTLQAQHYEADSGPDSSSDSIGPSIGWTTILTPRLTVHANGGALATHKSGANIGAGNEADVWNYTFAGGVTYKDAVNDFDFTAKRSREPFGNGTDTLLDTYSVTETYTLNEHLALNGKAKYQSADYPALPGVNLDSGYTLGGGIAYKVLEDVALTADYRYRNESLTNTASDVEQHVVMVGFTIHPAWSGK